MGWAALLDELNIRPGDLLRQADLPEDLLTRDRPVLEAEPFFRLWHALIGSIASDTPVLSLCTAISAEVFSPPIFAAFCSPNLLTAFQRLADYKPLIGPMKLDLFESPGGLEATCRSPDVDLPADFVVAELCLLVQLARLGVKDNVVPLAVEMVEPPADPAFEAYFGRMPRQGAYNRLVFAREDIRRPFVAANPALFAVFEPDLRARLDQLQAEARFADKVQSILMEALPSGRADTEEIARRLGVSQRSLQRRLAAEGTSFKSVLQSLRRRLAETYLGQPRYAIGEIAFLLGYEDPNSFFRAFQSWTGTTPQARRRKLLDRG